MVRLQAWRRYPLRVDLFIEFVAHCTKCKKSVQVEAISPERFLDEAGAGEFKMYIQRSTACQCGCKSVVVTLDMTDGND